MKKKNEVYVRVDTPKKAKKLAKVLYMFGEEVYRPTKKRLSNGIVSYEYPLVNYNFEWTANDGYAAERKTEVTIKELRKILAVENLKKGDVVVVYNKHGKWIIKLTGNDIERFEHSSSYDLDLSLLNDKGSIEKINKIYGGSFIRYATEEEKALLNPKPELEAGKWYNFAWSDMPKEIRGIYFVEKVEGYQVWFSYGIDLINDEWEESDWYNKCHVWTEATPQEVEHALINEAKKRGYVEGARIKCLLLNQDYTLTSRKHWEDFDGKELLMVESRGTGVWIFRAGKWAEVVKEAPKFEVKIDGDAIKDYVEKFHSDERGDSHTVSLRLGNYQFGNSKLYYKYNSECQLVFIRSSVSPIHGEWNLYSGKDINELI